MDLKALNNRTAQIYASNSAIAKSPAIFSPEKFINSRTLALRNAIVARPSVNTWVNKGTAFRKVHSKQKRDVNGFLSGDIGADQTVLYGAGAIAALIGWSLWSSYNQKKSEAEATKLEIESLKLQAQSDEGRRQELIGQVIVLQNQLNQIEAQKEGLRSGIETKIDSLPPEDYIKIPGEVVNEVKKTQVPWVWLIIGGLLIGGLSLWKIKSR